MWKNINNLKQIKAGRAVMREKEKGNQASIAKTIKIDLPCEKNHLKHSAFHIASTIKPRGKKITKRFKLRHCKWCKQKGGPFLLHDTANCMCYNIYLASTCSGESECKKSLFAYCIEVHDIH